MKSLMLVLVAVVLVGCGKKTPKKPQTGKRSITLAQFLKGKRIHFQLDNGAGPFWSEFATDGTIRHSDRPAGTYEVHGLKVDVQDSNGPIKKVELIFLSSEISVGDTFEAKALGGIKRLHGKVLKVEKTPGLTTKVKAPQPQATGTQGPSQPEPATDPQSTLPAPNPTTENPLTEEESAKVIEAAIREELFGRKGKLTKADLEKVKGLRIFGKKLTSVKGLEKLTKLEELHLGYNQLTNVKGLEELTKLTVLGLAGNKLTDLKGLEKLTQLKELNLGSNQLTNVTALENLTQLKRLDLQNNKLTEVPKGLEKLTQLTYLTLRFSPDLTKAQIDQLQKALPKCNITHNATK